MDVLGWLWWMVSWLLSLVWFLLGGWVSTLLQIVALALAIFVFKYGWRRGPIEMWHAGEGARRFVWGWVKGVGGWRSAAATAGSDARRQSPRVEIRTVRVKEIGDVNLSTLMSVSAMAGVALLTLLK